MAYPAVILAGRFSAFCAPAKLYHGTTEPAAIRALVQGLRPDVQGKQSALSSNLVYLTTDAGMAAHFARSRAFHTGETPVVLEVDSSQLEADRIGFDLNMCGRFWSQSVTYDGLLPARALVQLPAAAAEVQADPMQFAEPQPGVKPLVFEMRWVRAPLFLAHAQVKPT